MDMGQMNTDQQRMAKVLQAEIYGQEMKRLEREYEMLMLRIQEMEKTIKALDEVSSKKTFRAIVPIGSDVLVRANIEDASEFLVAVSSKYFVKMSHENARDFLLKQKKILGDAAEKLEKQFEAIEAQFQKVVEEIREMEEELHEEE